MSEASRSTALAHAIAVHGPGDPDAVLVTAERFHAYMTDATPEAKPVKSAAAKPAAAKPAAAKPKPAPEPEPEEVADTDEVTKEQVGEAIEAMLNANLRNEAIALFAKYKAKSLSGVKPEDYAALKQAAEDAVLSA
jgi:hypothetical protein